MNPKLLKRFYTVEFSEVKAKAGSTKIGVPTTCSDPWNPFLTRFYEEKKKIAKLEALRDRE
jgi:hypothetical protein